MAATITSISTTTIPAPRRRNSVISFAQLAWNRGANGKRTRRPEQKPTIQTRQEYHMPSFTLSMTSSTLFPTESCSNSAPKGSHKMLYAHQQYILCIYYNVTCLERILSQHSLEPCPKSKASGTKTNSGCSQTGCSVVQSRNRSTDSSTNTLF